MTTIAYRDGVLASDTLITSGTDVSGYYQKGRRIGLLLYASTGSCGLGDTFEAWLRGGCRGDQPSLKNGDSTAHCIVVMPDGLVVWFHQDGMTPMRTPYHAVGSGSAYAIGAMAAGATAAEAVRIAMLHDTGTGGDVTTLSITKEKTP